MLKNPLLGVFQEKEEQEGLLVSRTASCLFQEPLKEEHHSSFLVFSSSFFSSSKQINTKTNLVTR